MVSEFPVPLNQYDEARENEPVKREMLHQNATIMNDILVTVGLGSDDVWVWNLIGVHL